MPRAPASSRCCSTGLQPGGQLMITTDVENYPGFADAIQGPFLMEQMQAQAEHVGTRIIHDLAMSVDFSPPPVPRATGDSGDVYLADTVVIATGRAGALARPAVGDAAAGRGRLGLRHVRRFLLPRQAGRGGRRRQHRGGGGAVPHPPRRQGHARAPPRLPAGREDPAAPAVRAPQDRGGLGQRGRGGARRRPAGGGRPGCGCATSRRARRARWRWTACSSPSATCRTPASSAARSTLDDDGYVLTAARPDARPRCPACSPPATCRTSIWRQAVTAAGTGCMAALEAERFLTLQAAPTGLAEAAE